MYDTYTLERYWLTVSNAPEQLHVRPESQWSASDVGAHMTELKSDTASPNPKTTVRAGQSAAAFQFELIRSTPVSFH